ncbi:MAG: hypothetical protein ABSB91_02875 [Sedimentisphaerales bacterium]
MIALRNDINHHSHMSTLSAGISEELEDYYKRNDRYPENLQISRVSILKMMYPHKKPEGPNIMDYFNGFKYSTDGNSYNIIWEARHGDTIYTHKEEGLKGELPRTELYINGELLKGR